MTRLYCITSRPSSALQSGLTNEQNSGDSLNGLRSESSPEGLRKRVRRLSHKYDDFEQQTVVNITLIHFDVRELRERSSSVSKLEFII